MKADPLWWKHLFDEIYLVTDARSVQDEEITRREVDLICQILPLDQKHWILDMCGGQGRHSLELSRRGFKRCVVLDYSLPLLRHGRRAAQKENLPVHFVQGDAREAGLARNTFHHVLILGNSLGYSPGTKDDELILAQAHNLLRPGGWVLLDVTDGTRTRTRFNPNTWHEIGHDILVCRQRKLEKDAITTREVVLSKTRGLIRDATYSIRLYEPETLASLVKKAGFTQVQVHPGPSLRRDNQDYGFMNHRVIITGVKS